MPTSPPSACSVSRCPYMAVPGGRGRCARHRLTEAERGYGRAHRIDRAVHRPGAYCEACGCTRNLQRDHRIPHSLGGGEEPANKRWLCRCPEHRCHDRLGVRRDMVGGRGFDGIVGRSQDTRATLYAHRQLVNPEVGGLG
jgi:hypothetical protein